jgi:hypothetical protein
MIRLRVATARQVVESEARLAPRQSKTRGGEGVTELSLVRP